MLFSDVVTDIISGDVTPHDVRMVQYASQIKVAEGYFEYAQQLEEHADEFSQVVIEAAEAEGLPTKKSEAGALATAASSTQLSSFGKQLKASAAKIASITERNMKAIVGLAKKHGVDISQSQRGGFASAVAGPLAAAIVKDQGKGKRNITFVQGVFPTKGSAHDLMFNYCNALISIGAAFGANLENVADDPIVRSELSIDANIIRGIKNLAGSADKGNPSGSIKDLYKNLTRGATYLKPVDVKTTKSISAKDLADVFNYTYVMNAVSKAVESSDVDDADNFVKKLCSAETAACEGKISRKLESVNSSVSGWSTNLTKLTEDTTKAFSDAVGAIASVSVGKTENLTEWATDY